MNYDRKRILAIFAHPDDETFLAGGTLAKYAAAGCDVFLLCATHGEAGKRGDYIHLTQKEFAEVRQRELEAAARVLGIHPALFLECADRGLARDCWNAATEEIVRTMRRVKPHVVLTFGPEGLSGHVDHVALSQIVTAAFWAAGAPSYLPGDANSTTPFRPVRLYFVLRSASVPQCCEPANQLESPPLTTIIDIAEFGRPKLEAIRCYRSQKHLQPNEPSAIEAILKAPENFHRAVPVWDGTQIETDLFEPCDETGSTETSETLAGIHPRTARP